jgi:hypothetical protein
MNPSVVGASRDASAELHRATVQSGAGRRRIEARGEAEVGDLGHALGERGT